MQEMINKDLEELKNKQTEMNNTINETKNTPEGINSRITEAEERISDLEDKIVEITTEEQTEEKRMKRIEEDRKSVVQGKSVDLGGRRIIKKKRKNELTKKYVKGKNLQDQINKDEIGNLPEK